MPWMGRMTPRIPWLSWILVVLLFTHTACTQVKQTPSAGQEMMSQENVPDAAVELSPDIPSHSTPETSNESVVVEQNVPTSPDQTASSGVWGSYGMIDIHAHIGTFRGYDLSTPTLMSNVQKYGIQLALISNIDGANLEGTTRNLREQQANQATVDVVRAYPKQLRGLAWTRPNDGNPQNIEPFLKLTITPNGKDRIFVGMKFHPEMNQFPADSIKLDAYMKLCETYKVAAVFHNGGPDTNSSPERIYKLAQRFPTVSVVLYHSGFGGTHQASIQIVKQSIQNKDAQLFLETAQADPQAVLQAVRDVGSHRIMFGTDATYYGAHHYDSYKPMIELLRKHLSDADFFRIVRDNAKQVFALP